MSAALGSQGSASLYDDDMYLADDLFEITIFDAWFEEEGASAAAPGQAGFASDMDFMLDFSSDEGAVLDVELSLPMGHPSIYGSSTFFDYFGQMFRLGSFDMDTTAVLVVDTQYPAQDASARGFRQKEHNADKNQETVHAESNSPSLEELEERISTLEESNKLLASDFDTNSVAFWDACAYDVALHIDQLPPPASVDMYAFVKTTVEFLNAHSFHLQDECQVGVQRMSTWFQIQEVDVDTGGDDSSFCTTFITSFCVFFIIILLIRCCCAAAARSRERRQRLRRQLTKGGALRSTVKRKTEDVVEAQAVTAAPVAVVKLEEGVYYL